MKKKLLSVVMTLALGTGMLAGCGEAISSSDTASTTAATAAATEAAAQDTTEAPAAATESTTEGATETAAADDAISSAALKIAIVSSPSGVDDGSFNENNYNGILDFIAEAPNSTVTPVQETTGDVTACIQKVSDIVADYDVIVLCGYQFAAIGDIADANPDVDFILVDSTPTYADGSTKDGAFDNVYSMTFKEQESGFPAGIAAALATKSNKVAVVNGLAYPSNVNYQYGFMSGVYYANAEYGTSAEIVELPSYAGTDANNNNVGGNYIGSFNDEATGKTVGDNLIKEGVDVIFVAAGNSGNGVFTAAKEADGVYVIGCDVDQYDDGANGSSNIVLTSGLKIMDKNVKEQLEKIAEGTFKGEDALLGADTDSTGYVSEEGRCQLTADEISKIDEAFAKVKDGTVVPASFGGTTPDEFKASLQ
ncbi:MAG: BMP family protein [Lachnospiraceae bacterium]